MRCFSGKLLPMSRKMMEFCRLNHKTHTFLSVATQDGQNGKNRRSLVDE
jgi:hypothetical protein